MKDQRVGACVDLRRFDGLPAKYGNFRCVGGGGGGFAVLSIMEKVRGIECYSRYTSTQRRINFNNL